MLRLGNDQSELTRWVKGTICRVVARYNDLIHDPPFSIYDLYLAQAIDGYIQIATSIKGHSVGTGRTTSFRENLSVAPGATLWIPIPLSTNDADRSLQQSGGLPIASKANPFGKYFPSATFRTNPSL